METKTEAPLGITTWELDPTHSSVAFAIRHLMIATVRGRFGAVTARVDVDDANPSNSKVFAEIQSASIETGEPNRDAHLKSADFFDAEKNPLITFASRKIVGDPSGDFKLSGDLTISGVTRDVTIDITADGRGRDPWGGERSAFSATTKIKRSEFGLTWNQALETGGVVVGDEVKITIDVELVRKAESAQPAAA